MTVTFGRLSDLSPRDAWAHEAHTFTPWLAENIDQLSDAVGIPLELTGTEMAVDTFSADIVARNAADGSVVLIENQLEQTDHTHLGQIMTYLAGLEAHAVIWIAPRFREPHLSAIRWLNEHTSDEFGFFAVRLRVVQIGDSPYAPVFEIEEKPNGWEQRLRIKVQSDGAAYYDHKEAFWSRLLDRHPHLGELGMRVWRYSNNYVSVHTDPQIEVAVYFGKRESGIFVRSGWGQPAAPVIELLEPYQAQLSADLGAEFGPTGRGDWLLAKSMPLGQETASDWDEIADWMNDAVDRWRTALGPVLQRSAA